MRFQLQNPLTKFKPKKRSGLFPFDWSADVTFDTEPDCDGPECEHPECYQEFARLEDTDILGSFADVMISALYSDPIMANLPTYETIKTPLIWICGRPWWIWCDRIDDGGPVTIVWIEDRLNVLRDAAP